MYYLTYRIFVKTSRGALGEISFMTENKGEEGGGRGEKTVFSLQHSH